MIARPTSARRRLSRLPARDLPGGLRVYEAITYSQRRTGLAGVDALPSGWALHIPRCRSVHTLGMRFALDLVWLDATGAVVRVDHAVGPRRQRGCVRARSVVECTAGEGERFAALLDQAAAQRSGSPPSPARRRARPVTSRWRR